MANITIDVAALKEALDIEAHPAQQEILLAQEKHKYCTVQCGRKFGKSFIASYIAIKQSFLANQMIWIVAPTYEVTEAMRQYIDPWAEKLGFKINEKKKQILNPYTGSVIQFKTADNPKTLLGMDVHLAILDEAAEIAEEVFTQRIEPNFAATNGKAVFISTPLGTENWHHKYYLRGQSTDYTWNDWCSFHFTSYDNPYASRVFLDSKRESLPNAVFEQQYMANPQSSFGLTFSNSTIENIVGPYESIPAVGGYLNRYITSWDIASLNDFSALGTLDIKDKKVISIEDPFQGELYGAEGQLNRVYKHCIKNHSSTLYIDSAGGGANMAFQAIQQWMQAKNIYCEAFPHFGTVKSKADVFQYLLNEMEKWNFQIPAHKALIKELRENRYKLTPNGVPMYHAPRGLHDDLIAMLAMLIYKGMPVEYIEVMESYGSNQEEVSLGAIYGRA